MTTELHLLNAVSKQIQLRSLSIIWYAFKYACNHSSAVPHSKNRISCCEPVQ